MVNRTELVVMVPASAVVTFAGIEKVFVSESGKALEKSITTGQHTGKLVEVTSGLNAGETVILDPGNLQNGQAVSVTVESGPTKDKLSGVTEENSG